MDHQNGPERAEPQAGDAGYGADAGPGEAGHDGSAADSPLEAEQVTAAPGPADGAAIRPAAPAGPAEAAASGSAAADGAAQVPASRPAAATGEPRVDAALRLLERLPGLPVSDHPELFEQVHAQLSEVLGELDSGPRPGSGPAGR